MCNAQNWQKLFAFKMPHSSTVDTAFILTFWLPLKILFECGYSTNTQVINIPRKDFWEEKIQSSNQCFFTF